MGVHGESDEVLLASGDAASFEAFYVRHVDELLGFFARRTRDAEAAADLTAETFAAALTARRRYRPDKGSAGAWLYGIALKKLADLQRRGYVERKGRRRLGMERLELTDADIARIERARRRPHRDAPRLAARARAARRGRRARRGRAQLRGHRGRARHLGGRRAQARQPRAADRPSPDGAPTDGRPGMTDDFTARLRLQLREAALREEDRGGLARAGPPCGRARRSRSARSPPRWPWASCSCSACGWSPRRTRRRPRPTPARGSSPTSRSPTRSAAAPRSPSAPCGCPRRTSATSCASIRGPNA